MNPVFESSVVIRGAAPALGDSRLVTGVRRLASWVTRRMERRTPGVDVVGARGVDGVALATVTAESRLMAWLEALLSVPAIAWCEAELQRVVRPATREIAVLDAGQRVWLCGVFLLAAVMTETALQLFHGISTRPLTIAARLAVAGCGVGLMSESRAIAAAWNDRRLRRAMRGR